MSELESNAARSSSILTANVKSKLNSFARGGTVDGLADAFADVFARIAASSAPPASPETNPSDRQSEVLATDQSDPSEASEGVDDSDEKDEAKLTNESSDASTNEAFIVPNSQATTQVELQVNEDDDDRIEVDPSTVIVTRQEAFENGESDHEQLAAANVDQVVESSIDEITRQKKTLDKSATQERPAQSSSGLDADHRVANVASSDLKEGLPTSDQPTSVGTNIDSETSDDAPRDRRNGRRDSRTVDPTSSPRPGIARATGETNTASPVQAAGNTNEVSPITSVNSAADSSSTATGRINAAVANVAAAAGVTQSTSARSSAALSPGTNGESGVAGPRGVSMSIEPPAGSRAESAARTNASSDKGESSADMMTRIKLIQRVSKAFQHLGADGGVVRLRLAPAELGTVRVEMRIQQKRVEARVVADTDAAASALREHLHDLRSRLESFGLQVDRIEVETESSTRHNESSQSQTSNQSDQQSAWNRGPRQSSRPTVGRSDRDVLRSAARPSDQRPLVLNFVPAGGVDVRL